MKLKIFYPKNKKRQANVTQKQLSKHNFFSTPNFPTSTDPMSNAYSIYRRNSYFCFEDLEIFHSSVVTERDLIEGKYLEEIVGEIRPQVVKMVINKLNQQSYINNPKLFMSNWIEKRTSQGTNYQSIQDPAIWVCSKWTNDFH